MSILSLFRNFKCKKPDFSIVVATQSHGHVGGDIGDGRLITDILNSATVAQMIVMSPGLFADMPGTPATPSRKNLSVLKDRIRMTLVEWGPLLDEPDPNEMDISNDMDISDEMDTSDDHVVSSWIATDSSDYYHPPPVLCSKGDSYLSPYPSGGSSLYKDAATQTTIDTPG
jgi:hypothetical protein